MRETGGICVGDGPKPMGGYRGHGPRGTGPGRIRKLKEDE